MPPPLVNVGDEHVHHEIARPVPAIAILQDEGKCAQLHLEQALAQLSRLEANVYVKLLAAS